MEVGKVVEIIGAVIDVQFPRNSMPKVFDALIVDESGCHWKFSNKLEMELSEQLQWVPPMDLKEE